VIEPEVDCLKVEGSIHGLLDFGSSALNKHVFSESPSTIFALGPALVPVLHPADVGLLKYLLPVLLLLGPFLPQSFPQILVE